MVASGANGFTQIHETTHAQLSSPPPAGTCSKTPFNYHTEYLTSSPANQGSWIFANVNFSFEIGHGELCGDASCSILPDGGDMDDTGCITVLGVGICTGADLDHDGLSYIPDWPDGTTNHPSPLIIGNVSNNGMGPLSLFSGSYQAPYGAIFFQPANVAGAFYPFFSQAGTGASCVFNFGNDIPGTTVNDFGKATQYGTTIPNPCAGAAPTFTKAFGASTVPLGGTTSLTFTITNPNPTLVLTGVSFNDSLPTGMTETGPVTGSGCGGFAVSGLPNAIDLNSITIAAGGACTILAAVAGASPGVSVNTTSSISASDSSFTGASVSATLTVVAPPVIAKTFATAIVPLNHDVTLTFKITNPNATVPLMGVSFTDTLPLGLAVDGAPTLSGCGTPAVTGAPAAVNMSGGTIASLGTCTLSVPLKGIAGGVQNNTTGNVISMNGGTGNSASATITVVLPPVITKAFGLVAIPVGATTSLSFTISNPNTATLLTVAFTDTLPAGLAVASPNGLNGSCGSGTITAVPGASVISLSGGTIPATDSCTFSVNVVSTSETAGAVNSATVTSLEGATGNTANAMITVGTVYEISYASNLNVGDSVLNLTNAGTLSGTAPAGNICVNVYAFDPGEEMVACCSCLVTPDGLNSLSDKSDLINNTLTPAVPISIVVKLLATAPSGGTCNPASPVPGSLVLGLRAWGTSLHALPTVPGGYATTEFPATAGALSATELANLTSLCGFIQGNGSGFGICNSCRTGGLGGVKE